MTRSGKPQAWLKILIGVCCFFATLTSLSVAAPEPVAGNRLLTAAIEPAGSGNLVKIASEKPVGYRYTVYDSFDPVRVVIDFPGMDVSALPPSIKADGPLVTDLKVSSFDLTSGKLGRIEINLVGAADYSVTLTDTEFKIIFSGLKGGATEAAAAPEAAATPATATSEPSPPAAAPAADAATTPPPPAADAASQPSPSPEATPTPAATGPAHKVTAIRLDGGTAYVDLDGTPEKFQHFPLKTPNRLVLDLYGVKPQFKERTLPASQGFNKIRVGDSGGKTRLVFDASGKLPKYSVEREVNTIKVSWGKAATQMVTTTPETAVASAGKTVKTGGPVTVENVEFQVDDKTTLLKITLSAPGQYSEPVADGKLVRFDVRRASISRALRRSLDSSAFPSAIEQVTPYLVQEKGRNDVRFAVELKGPAPYTLKQDGNLLLFTVENQAFAEAAPADVSKLTLNPPAPAAPGTASASQEAVPVAVAPLAPAEQLQGAAGIESKSAEAEMTVIDTPEESIETGHKRYKGQKISLVFDNADIRNILQLIGEVSQLNVIAGDEVKGTITLRLIDVPWDQALDLIMETKGLGALKEGNVLRIMPKDKLRTMRQEELKADKEVKSLEPTIDVIIPISYTALNNISGPIKDRLSEQGKITEDSRNKQLIITDIPSKIKEIRELIAKLDTPERQVMIEARIVQADTAFTRDLGIRWGVTYDQKGSTGAGQPSVAQLGMGGQFSISPLAGANLMSGSGLTSGITFGNLGVNTTVLDLRISALETSRRGKVISSPRITTLNGGQATISQGTKIPYQSVGNEGTKTEFVDANLELKVTPVINPDGSVILDIEAKNSSPTQVAGADAPAISTKEAKTKVLINDGDTTVIGGVIVENDDFTESGVPILRSIPLIGHLFKNTIKTKTQEEMLIFITPRILN